MREKTKRELYVLLDVLQEANEKIEVLINGNYIDTLVRVLEMCQNVAISAGTMVEKEEGLGTKAVGLLEEYCENLYLVQTSGRIEFTQMNDILQSTREKIAEFENTYEIYFLPYKASMWDCMESVWKAMKKLPNCNCHVVPIPYYYKNERGELCEFHYEGGNYPQEVPIEDWRECRLPQVQPDVIFIHNPYDHMNYVTTIHPDFYGEKLKAYTKRLVLLPYAVSSKEHVAEEFSITPGILYANDVIVQSKTLCKEHICWFHKYEEDYQCKGLFGNAEEKFKTFGSPKFDKVLNTKREDWKFPADWQKKAQSANGCRKYTVLLNTSMNQLLHAEEVYMSKLRAVVEIFKKYQDCLLVWRPHPLMEQTLRSMRPTLLKDYQEIIWEFKEGDWGIYDDSPDMYQAIAFTDAYYGDWSSVATLYQCAGKPVILQNHMNFKAGKLEYKMPLAVQQFYIADFSICGFDMYLYDGLGDVIYRADIRNGEAEPMVRLPHGKYANFNYSDIACIGEYLVAVPLQGADIVLYHLRTGELSTYKVENSLRFCQKHEQFLFFTPMVNNPMVRMEFGNSGDIYVTELEGWDPEATRYGRECVAGGLPLPCENKIFIPYRGDYGVAEFDCDLQRVVKHHCFPDCATMAQDEEKYWWCDKHGLLYCWDGTSEDSTFIHDFKGDLGWIPEDLLVHFLAYAEGFLYLFPHQYYSDKVNKTFRVNTFTLEVEEIAGLRIPAGEKQEANKRLQCYCGAVLEEGRIYTYCNVRNTVIAIDPITSQYTEVPMRLHTGFLTNEKRDYIVESPVLLLEYFLEYFGYKNKDSYEGEKSKSLLESRAWKSILLRKEVNGEQDVGREYWDGKCGERVANYLLEKLEEDKG